MCTNGNAGTCGLQDDQYAYDAVGNVVINVIGTQTMTYDALGNLCTQGMTTKLCKQTRQPRTC